MSAKVREIIATSYSIAVMPFDDNTNPADFAEEVLRMLGEAGYVVSDWKPIETAPKNGDFLAFIANGYVTRGRFHQGKFFAADSFGPSAKNNDTRPSHWMPLPEPPR